MGIVDLLSEAGEDDVRSGLPDSWRLLALAAAGEPEGTEVVNRLAPAGSEPEAALEAAAKRWNASGAWPSNRLSAFTSDETTPLGQWRTICLGPKSSRIALADTTTLFTALQLVQAGNADLVTPLTVLDLVGFLDAACLYDRICFLENPHVSLAALESAFGSDLFIELPVASTAQPGSDYAQLGDIRDELRSVYRFTTVPWINNVRTGQLGTKKQRKAWLKAWTTILRRKCDPDWLLRDPDEGGSADYDDVWNTPTASLFDDIVAVMTEQLARADRGHAETGRNGQVFLAQTSNARALFNAALAQRLDVPYTASAARYPILRLLIQQTRGEFAELMRTSRGAQALEAAFGASAEDMTKARPDALRLPVFPSGILNRVQLPAQIPEQLAWVRDRSAGLRKHLAEMDYHLRVGDRAGRRVKADLRAALNNDTARWEQFVPFAEAGAASGHAILAWADPKWHLIGVTVALLEGLIAAGTTQSILAAHHPRYQVLRRLDPAVDSGPVVARLWDLPDPDLFAERLAELAQITARP